MIDYDKEQYPDFCMDYSEAYDIFCELRSDEDNLSNFVSQMYERMKTHFGEGNADPNAEVTLDDIPF
jgi:hypothetical protein